MARKKRDRANGEGTYYQRKSDKRWVVELTVDDPESGQPKRIIRYAKTKGEAKRLLENMNYDNRKGSLIVPSKTTLSQWLEKYMPTIRNSCSPNIYYRKMNLITNHIDGEDIGKKHLQDILPIDLESYYIRLQRVGKKKKVKDENGKVIEIISIGGLSSQTVRHIHNIINPALEKAVDNGVIPRNPAAKVNKKRVLKLVLTREAHPLNVDEVSKYIKAVSHRRLASLFILDICTGMRRGELLGLHWADLNHEKRELKLERQVQRVQNLDGPGSSIEYTPLKTSSSNRKIILPVMAFDELPAHKERQDQEKAAAGKGYKDEDLIFCTAIGTKLDPRRIYDIHCQTLVKAGLKHTAFHNLRHTVATLLLQNGESARSIQELLGHADIKTTLGTYGHVLDEMKAATAERIDGIFLNIFANDDPVNP